MSLSNVKKFFLIFRLLPRGFIELVKYIPGYDDRYENYLYYERGTGVFKKRSNFQRFFDSLFALLLVSLFIGILFSLVAITSSLFIAIILLSIVLFGISYIGYHSERYDSLQIELAHKYDQVLSHQMPEKLFLFGDYVGILNSIQSFVGPKSRKLSIAYCDNHEEKLYIEMHNWISKLDITDKNNQDYIILFTEIQNSINFDNFSDSSFELVNPMNEHNQQIPLDLKIVPNFRLLFLFYMVILISIFALMWFNIFGKSVASFLCFLNIYFMIIIYILTDQKRKKIIRNIKKLRLNIRKFNLLNQFFEYLSKTEKAVFGIDASIVSEMGNQIEKIISLRKEIQSNFLDMNRLAQKKSIFFSLKNMYSIIQDVVRKEYVNLERNFTHFQGFLEDWLQFHLKDLQNHQQEIQQIHQSLLQNKNENSEVITLLEKNFNLHLQSAKKVENSI